MIDNQEIIDELKDVAMFLETLCDDLKTDYAARLHLITIDHIEELIQYYEAL